MIENDDIKLKSQNLMEEIIRSILYELRYKASIWPKESNIKEMERITKSHIVQFLRKQKYD